MFVTCGKCGESNNLNILTGECYSCGVDEENDPLYSKDIKNGKLSKDLMVRGIIRNGNTEMYVINKKGVIIAKGWK